MESSDIPNFKKLLEKAPAVFDSIIAERNNWKETVRIIYDGIQLNKEFDAEQVIENRHNDYFCKPHERLNSISGYKTISDKDLIAFAFCELKSGCMCSGKGFGACSSMSYAADLAIATGTIKNYLEVEKNDKEWLKSKYERIVGMAEIICHKR